MMDSAKNFFTGNSMVYGRPMGTLTVALETKKRELAKVHREVLQSCFEDKYLESENQLVSNVKDGTCAVFSVRENFTILGTVVIEHVWAVGKKVMLISWIGVIPAARGRNVGTLLIEEAVNYAKTNGAVVLLGEVEDPEKFDESDPAYGNPAKRVEFYSRFNCQRMDIPYVVQLEDESEEFGMMLTMFPLSAEQTSAEFIDVPELSLFIDEFVGVNETAASERLVKASCEPVGLTPFRSLVKSIG